MNMVMQLKKVYMVEDEAGILSLIRYACRSEYEFKGFQDGKSFLEILASDPPDLVLLDLMVPLVDGFEILHHMKQKASLSSIPVIVVSANDMEITRIQCLENGADDFVPKPFSVMELMARIRAVLRRFSQPETEYRFADIQVDVGHHRVRKNGSDVCLTGKEFKLLRFFMEHQGMVLSRETLLEQVWGFDYAGETRTVDVHIKELRQKLGLDKEQLKTLYGIGYRLGQ